MAVALVLILSSIILGSLGQSSEMFPLVSGYVRLGSDCFLSSSSVYKCSNALRCGNRLGPDACAWLCDGQADNCTGFSFVANTAQCVLTNSSCEFPMPSAGSRFYQKGHCPAARCPPSHRFDSPEQNYQSFQVCGGLPCVNGTCRFERDTVACKCTVGYVGPSCDILDACNSTTCYNGSTCLTLTKGAQLCLCPAEMTGSLCDTRVTPQPTGTAADCESSPCQNGGSCVLLPTNGSSACLCAVGYFGAQCESNPCESNPCANSGTCVFTSSGSQACLCPFGTFGNTCQYEPCVSNPCANSGSCIATGDQNYVCQCIGAFTGSNCEIPLEQTPAECPSTIGTTRESIVGVPDVSTLPQNTTLLVFNSYSVTNLTARLFQRLPQLLEMYIGYYENRNRGYRGGGNNLTHVPADAFNGLSALTTLGLQANQIATLEDGCFSGLTKLQKLFLNNNRLTTLLGSVFSNLTSLQQLYLGGGSLGFSGGNSLTQLGANALSGLSALTTLDLSYNQIATLEPGCFDGLGQLQQLYLSNNRLTSLPANVLTGLAALGVLDLQQNSIASLDVGSLNGLNQLQEIDLHYNQLTTVPAGVFTNSTLQKLSLYHNLIATLESGCFDGQTQMNELWLWNNRLTALPAGVFANMPALKILSIYSNSLAPLDGNFFSTLPIMQQLEIDYNVTVPASTYKSYSYIRCVCQSMFCSCPSNAD